ncbi:MAG TPA: ATP-binding cassette domain-containing protein [Terriglobales bacterium]|nr:ATP-binding cassette domain-containing protein [Terriglobales bacterium]
MSAVIAVRGLRKEYKVHHKEGGFLGSVKALVNRRYSTVTAVDGVSFEIAEGEIIGFLGPNGAGKTTTLKMLAGLLHPSGGEVSVLGFEPKQRHTDFLRAITLVMGQKQQLAWDLAAIDSFLLNRVIYDIPEDVYRQRIGELSEMLSLQQVLNKPVRKLSLGERMKCELALALLHQPKILFLDEPTIGLDVNMQRAVRDFIAAYNDRYRATIMLTSHYMDDVEALARRVMVIDGGRIAFDGDLHRLIAEQAPKKVLRLKLIDAQPAARLSQYAELRRLEDLEAELLVERQHVPETASRLLAELPVADIAIEEQPIEDVIGALFRTARDKKTAAPSHQPAKT